MALNHKMQLAYSRFKSIQGNEGECSFISSWNGLEIFCRTYIYTFDWLVDEDKFKFANFASKAWKTTGCSFKEPLYDFSYQI